MNYEFEDMLKRLTPTLRRIAHKMNGHFSFFDDDDLIQEALVHLWVLFQKGAVSDKTDSYILQGCYFHLKNYIRKSIEKVNPVSLNGFIDEEGTEIEEFLSLDDSGPYDGFEETSLMEAIESEGLTDREKKVLSLSLEGFTVREIGERLGVSHVAIIKMKKKLRSKLESFKTRP